MAKEKENDTASGEAERQDRPSHRSSPSEERPSELPVNGEFPEILPHEVRQIAQQVVAFQGPLPPPEILRQYDEIVPGAAERMIAGAEQERSHRHSQERKALLVESWSQLLGMVFGFLIALAGFSAATAMAYLQLPWPAATTGGLTLAALVGVFVTGRLHVPESDASPSRSAGADKESNDRKS